MISVFEWFEEVRLLTTCRQCDRKFRTPNDGNTIPRNRDISVDVVIRLNGRGSLFQILSGARDIFFNTNKIRFRSQISSYSTGTRSSLPGSRTAVA